MTVSFELTDRVVLVTGGNGGIGLGIAQACAAAGADVAISGTNPAKNGDAERLLAATGRRAIALVCDVGDEAQVDAAFAQTVERLGKVDTVFANARIADPTYLFHTGTEIVVDGGYTIFQIPGRR